MAAFLLIFPVLCFDCWLLATTGRNQIKIWAEAKAWPRIAGLAGAGILMALLLAFFIKYSWGDSVKVIGFPIPTVFFRQDGGRWVESLPEASVLYPAIIANLLSGLAAPFIPFKAAEFLRSVKAELSHAPR